MHDVAIRGGTVVDGTGAPARVADVAIDGDLVAIVGPTVGPARREIDATGLLVTPGWVDMHTHYDAQASWDPMLTPSSWHGVTTAVMGNCGVGFAPVHVDRREWLIELMEGVEDIPGAAMTEGIDWQWETFPEYLDTLDRGSYALDIGTQIAHGALRTYVMGERGAADDVATAADVAKMAAIVADALCAGALGFSTSRTPVHRSKSGELVPGTTAGADEMIGLARTIAATGHGIMQMAIDQASLPTGEWPWIRDAAATGCPVLVNLNQPFSHPDLYRSVLDRLDAAHADGLPILAQVAGRSIGLLMCLDGSVNPISRHPLYADAAHLPAAERARVLLSRLDAFAGTNPVGEQWFGLAVPTDLHLWWRVDGEIDYEPDPRDSIGAVAERTCTDPMVMVVEHLCKGDGTAMITAPFANYAFGDLSYTHEVHQHPHTRMGLSDGGAHVGSICDGGMPTFMLTHWTRDRTRGPRLPLELVVHRQTQQTAELYGLMDRGVLAPGYRADVNVIDYEQLSFDQPQVAFDLPTGARRLVQRARGYVATIVRGVQTVDRDEPTGALPGRLVRGPQAA